MIKEVYGNILLSNSDAIVQGVAPEEKFTSGLAASVKEKWPAIEKDFRQYCAQGQLKPGDLWVWRNTDGLDVLNLVIHGNKNETSIDSLDRGLGQLVEYLKLQNLQSLAMPKIGTDVGDFDWREVKPLIERHLAPLEIPVYLYTIFNKNIAGVEE
jgi:O-acetyl-ADP-ribose deacetylase (regulator of RNase III)